MFWRYFSLALLLFSPSSRILTLSVELNDGQSDTQELARHRVARETEEELIDRIIKQLTSRTNEEQPAADDAAAKRDGELESESSNTLSLAADASSVQDPAKTEDGANDAGTSSGSVDEGGESKSEVVNYAPAGVAAPLSAEAEKESKVMSSDDTDFLITMFVISTVGFVGLMMAGVCYYKFRRSAKAASDVEYPAYGVTGPMKERVPSPGDRKLAQSAQMYHYQHQKQQMIAMEKANGDMKHDASDDDSEEDNVEGDYTVYECPGLAPTGEMEVKNPLFRGNDTPQAPEGAPGSQQTPSTQPRD